VVFCYLTPSMITHVFKWFWMTVPVVTIIVLTGNLLRAVIVSLTSETDHFQWNSEWHILEGSLRWGNQYYCLQWSTRNSIKI